MARNKGTFNLSANFQVKIQEALDPRVVVEKKSDLISKETWPHDGDTLYVYRGMQVGVAEECAVYILTDISKALSDDYSGWIRIGRADSEFSETSENAIQNQIVTKEFTEIRNLINEKPSYDIVDGVRPPDTVDLEGYATIQWVKDQDYATQEQIEDIQLQIDDLPGYDIVDDVKPPGGETPSFVTTTEFEELMARVHALEEGVIQLIFRE